MSGAPTPPVIDTDQRETFHQQGYVGPLTLCSPAEMATVRERLADLPSTVGLAGSWYRDRHVDTPTVHEMVAAVADTVTGVYGDDLFAFESQFFRKEPGDGPYPWHQDVNATDLRLTPQVGISAWIAIDPATSANGCPRFVPDTHTSDREHVPTDGNAPIGRRVDEVEKSDAVDVELDPGEMVLFDARVVHGSGKNQSDDRRLGLTARYAPTWVRANRPRPVLVAGEDRFGLNDYVDPPAGGSKD